MNDLTLKLLEKALLATPADWETRAHLADQYLAAGKAQRAADHKLFSYDSFKHLVTVRVCRLRGKQSVLARYERIGPFATVLSDRAQQNRLVYTALACRHSSGFKAF